jgi:hypothetical protein
MSTVHCRSLYLPKKVLVVNRLEKNRENNREMDSVRRLMSN